MTDLHKPQMKKKSCTHWVVLTTLLLIISLAYAGPVIAKQKIPKVKLTTRPMNLSKSPTTEQLMAAGQLGGQLYPTKEINTNQGSSKKSNLAFGHAIQAWNKHEYKKAVILFSKLLKEDPDSPWAAESALHIGCDARYNGRYNEADEMFNWIINNFENNDHPGAQNLVSKARLRLGILKIFQNNFDEAHAYFTKLKTDENNWRHRTYASHWIQRLSQTKKKKKSLLNCGVKALAVLLENDNKKPEAAVVTRMLPSSDLGYSLYDLKKIALSYDYKLTGRKLTVLELNDIPLPAIIQLTGRKGGDSGHYWVLEKTDGSHLTFFDPQSGRRFHQTEEEFSKEWDGIALIFSDSKNLPGTQISEAELDQIYGGCCGTPIGEGNLGNPGRNAGPGGSGNNPCGSPAWSVNMVNMNINVVDIPLWYNNPIGPSVNITLNYNSQSAIAYNEPFGNKWMFNYGSYLVVDTGGDVLVFMPDGKRDTFVYDGSGGYTAPYQVHNTLTRIEENHFELAFPDGTVYVYNIPSGTSSLQPFLVAIRDAHGQSLQFSYDTQVQLTTITDALGRNTTLTYNEDGLITQVNDPFGRSATFEYTPDHDLIRITDMGGYWSALSYDNDIYLTSIENNRGKWTFHTEPADGITENADIYPPPGDIMWESYRVTVTNPMGKKSEYFYFGGGDGVGDGYSWYVSPNDYIPWQDAMTNNHMSETPMTRYFLDDMSGRRLERDIAQIFNPTLGFVLYDFDLVTGNITNIEDSTFKYFTYTYNHMGRITSEYDAIKDITTNYTYAVNGVDLLEITNDLGSVIMTYNSAHQITSITDRLGNITEFTYNSFGQILSRTASKDVLNIITTYTYNPVTHQLLQIIKDGKIIESLSYDTIGRIRTRTDASGITLTYDYNNLNHLTATTYPDGKSELITYSDCCPRIIESITDRAGRTTRYRYDALKHLIEIINPENGISTYTYDASGNVKTFTDPNGNVTSFEYNPNNQVTKKTWADGKSISYLYDESGRLIQRTDDRGIQTTYEYTLNTLERINYSDDTPQITYGYDNYDRLIQLQDGTGTHNFTYDANSRLKTVDGPWANDTLTYNYDELGRKISVTPATGNAVSYNWDNINRLTGVQTNTGLYSYTYLGANPLIQTLTRPNGSTTAYQYDTLNRLSEISNQNSSSAVINQHSYTYNPQDLIAGETITNGNPIASFTDQLTTYDYNKVNQLTRTAAPEKNYTHDNDGNMTQGYTQEGYLFSASYDAENRLKSIEFTDSSAVVHKTEYHYNANSFLLREINYENNIVVKDTRFVRDGHLTLQERNQSNQITRQYAWGQNMGGGIGGLLSLDQGGQNYAYLYDGRGNVTALIDSTQAISATYNYDAFGNLLAKTGSLDQPYQFSTKSYNDKTGLSFYGYRFYSPVTGRWINRDPLGEQGGINLYGFVLNDPVNLVDPDGLWQLTIGGGWGLAGYVTFGNNNGHWNLGGGLGLGAGFAGNWDPANSDPNTPLASGNSNNGDAASLGLKAHGAFGLTGAAQATMGLSVMAKADNRNAAGSTTLSGGASIFGLGGGGSITGEANWDNCDKKLTGLISPKLDGSIGVGGFAFAGLSGGYTWK